MADKNLVEKMKALFGASDESAKREARPSRDAGAASSGRSGSARSSGSGRRRRSSRISPQSVSVITLGVNDLAPARRFYTEGFGWKPVFEDATIIFYQMNGVILGTWLSSALGADMRRAGDGTGCMSLSHNVATQETVETLIERLVAAGGTLLRAPDAPPHGGFRGYVADPDGHAWEIAHNPGFVLDEAGNVTFGV